MKKLLWIGGVLIVVGLVIVGVRQFGQGTVGDDTENGPSGSTRETNLPQVELVSASLYLVADDGSKTELQDNDFISPPATVQTSAAGEAVIHFADGSMARVSPDTTLTVQEASYDNENGKSNVRLGLSVGKIWSKVVELATPDSSWNVETSNAVATVRGTAFSSEASTTSTVFVGSENDVTITPINPDTKEQMRDKEAPLTEGRFIELRTASMRDLASGRTRVNAAVMTDAMRRAAWISQNENRDTKVNEIIREVKDRGLSPVEMRRELRRNMREELRTRLEAAGVTSSTIRQEIIDRLEGSVNTATTTTRATTTTTEPAPVARPVSLTVVTLADLALAVPEGKSVQFKAMAKFSDGTERDVTANVVWRVLGPIGSVRAGTFQAQLDASIAEAGEGSGAIVATFTTASGESFLGQTPIFKVKTIVDVNTGISG